mgnify:CR=1 FL=1
MKRTLLAAVLGGLITLVGGAVTAQAAPITVPKSTEAGTSLVQTTGYGYHHRHHRWWWFLHGWSDGCWQYRWTSRGYRFVDACGWDYYDFY